LNFWLQTCQVGPPSSEISPSEETHPFGQVKTICRAFDLLHKAPFNLTHKKTLSRHPSEEEEERKRTRRTNSSQEYFSLYLARAFFGQFLGSSFWEAGPKF